MLNNKNMPLKAYTIWDTLKGCYLYGYRHPLDIATFRSPKGAKTAVTHELRYSTCPDAKKAFKDQSRFQIRILTISDVGLYL